MGWLLVFFMVRWCGGGDGYAEDVGTGGSGGGRYDECQWSEFGILGD